MPNFLQKRMGTIPNEAMKLYCGSGSGLHVVLPKEQIYGFKKVGGRWGSREIYW